MGHIGFTPQFKNKFNIDKFKKIIKLLNEAVLIEKQELFQLY